KHKRNAAYHVFSLDRPIADREGKEKYVEVADPDNRYERSEQRMVFEQIAPKLPVADVELILKAYAGIPQRELARANNCTQSYISRRISRTVLRAQQLAAR